MRINSGRSPLERLSFRKARKAVQSDLLRQSLKKASKTKKSEYRRYVSESGVRIELSPKAKDMLRDNYIDGVLESGEPLRGISYDDYFKYYINKHGFKSDDIEQEYKQALKGDNASLREKEWRTNPDYIIPPRLYDNPLIVADRNAVYDKIRNDEELSVCEEKLVHAFTNWGYEGEKVYNEAMLSQRTKRVEKDIARTLSDAGIELSPDDELKIEVWGSEMKVSGVSEELNSTIAEALKKYAFPLSGIFADNRNLSGEQSAELIQLQFAESYLKDSGVSVFDIYLDENENIVGLPENFDKFIKENADKSDIIDKDNGDFVWNNEVRNAKNMRDTFLSAIDTVKSGRYDYFRSMVGVYSFKNGVLAAADK